MVTCVFRFKINAYIMSTSSTLLADSKVKLLINRQPITHDADSMPWFFTTLVPYRKGQNAPRMKQTV